MTKKPLPTLCRLLTLVTLLSALPAAHADSGTGDVERGRQAFQPCASCHQLGPSARAGFAPQLNGVIGRRAGSTPDYNYSEAMKKSGRVWSDATLAAFIKDPEGTVPGTRMRFFSLGYGERKIADLLAYLRTMPARP